MSMDIKTAISRARAKLIHQAKTKGIYENFGQKEVMQIREKFINSIHQGQGAGDASELINDFDQWCMTFDLSELKREV
jgi:hypothetical protein